MERLLVIMEACTIVGATLSFVVWAYYFVKSTKEDDSLYFRLYLRHVLVMAFFIVDNALIEQGTVTNLAPLLVGCTYLHFLYELLFSKKRMEKDDERDVCFSIIETYYGIDCKKFRKLSRAEQISILSAATETLSDGTTVKLMEDEEDWNDFECILNKK